MNFGKISLILVAVLLAQSSAAQVRAEVKPEAQKSAPQTPKKLQSYEDLVRSIRETRAASLKRVEQAVEHERVQEAWEIGTLIDLHVLQHKERADYGEQVIDRLSKDLQMDRSEIYRMLQFARAYPIVVPARQLSWSHYQALLSLGDPKEREAVAQEAEKQKWTRDQLREEVLKRNTPKDALAKKSIAQGKVLIPRVEPGVPNTYRIVRATVGPLKGQLVVDLGFSNYFDFQKLAKDGSKPNFKEGDIVQLTSPLVMRKINPQSGNAATQKNGSVSAARPSNESLLYTYRAYIFEVIDGDTVKAAVDLGFNVWTTQTLRLRGIDAPEILSADGKESKDYLDKLLRRESGERMNINPKPELGAPNVEKREDIVAVLVKTSRSDKYDRYLADLYLDGVNLNQALVDAGQAAPLET